ADLLVLLRLAALPRVAGGEGLEDRGLHDGDADRGPAGHVDHAQPCATAHFPVSVLAGTGDRERRLVVAADRARSLPDAGEASPADLLLLHETRQRLPTNVVHRRPEVDRRRRAICGTPGGVRLAAVDVDPAASLNFPAHGLPRPVTERLGAAGR